MLWLITSGFLLMFIVFTASGTYLLKMKKKKNGYITAIGVGFLLLGLFTLMMEIIYLLK